MQSFHQYLEEIKKVFRSREATEHSYRPALKNLLESISEDIEAINEPKRRTFGAPDLIIRKREVPLGYIEAKDVGRNLDKLNPREKEQLGRYRKSLNNLILTNSLEFRWYVRGNHKKTITLADAENFTADEKSERELIFLLGEFLHQEVSTVSTAKELAERMASTARLIESTIEAALKTDIREGRKEESLLYGQMKSFKEVLLHDFTEEKFADLYAQTIAYGLFSARCNTQNSPFTRLNAAHYLPKTNPFLRQLFNNIAGIDLDERIAWAVDDLAELLNRSDMSSILQDFGKRTRREDPVVHFYETFLSVYDPELREKRGVYYTPEPVVSYIVRSVDTLLQTDFGMPKGLADSSKIKVKQGENEIESHKLLILDPATGTGTFLYDVIRNIAARYEKNRGMWDGYVSQHLLPRIFGFELLVAPYAVAHLKLGLLLEETGYKFQSEERLRVYLTNTLEEADRLAHAEGLTRWLGEEADAANKVKQDAPVMVVLGNPPYSGHSANTGAWIKQLLHGKDLHTDTATEDYFKVDGKPLGERNPKWLNNDYVKFIRFAQWRIEQTGYGILAFITSNSYLDSPTFRGMRQALMNTFDDIYIFDLHGNPKRGEKAEDGSLDQNVFEITEGVSIGIFVKKIEQESKSCRVFHFELLGGREKWISNDNEEKELVGGKYKWLLENDISSTDWKFLTPSSPYYIFRPQDERLKGEYEALWSLLEIMPENSMGITSGDDKRFVKFERSDFEHDDLVFSKEVAYRPFDDRFILYKPNLLARARADFMRHFDDADNLALCVLRRPRNNIVDNFFVTNKITDKCIISTLDNAQIFPLFIYPTEKEKMLGGIDRLPSFSEDFIQDFSGKLGLNFIPEHNQSLKDDSVYTPEDVFNYGYAIFHSPTYRSRYAEFLKIDFPRLPLTSNVKLFRELVTLGSELVNLHLMEKDIGTEVTFPEKGSNEVEFVKYIDNKVWINKIQYFDNVPEEIWEFHIGGYRVADKWLKDRKGRTLSFDDLEHYEKIISALGQTIDLMQQIDEVIEENGGFPIN